MIVDVFGNPYGPMVQLGTLSVDVCFGKCLADCLVVWSGCALAVNSQLSELDSGDRLKLNMDAMVGIDACC